MKFTHIIWLLCLCLSLSLAARSPIAKIDKLSADQALEAIRLLDQLNSNTDFNHTINLITQFYQLTDTDPDESLRPKLYEIINQNVHHVSIFMKLAGLISFQNVLLVCMVIVGVVFVLSLCKDVIFFLGSHLAKALVKLLLNRRLLYFLGFALAGVCVYFKPDEINNPYFRMLFIFDWVTPLFGCIIFSITFTACYTDIQLNKNSQIDPSEFRNIHAESTIQAYKIVGPILSIVWATVAIYQQNWLVGVGTVMMIFLTGGFLFGSLIGGYFAGFGEDSAMGRCLGLSLIMNFVMIGVKSGVIIGDPVKYLSVFETGVFFWGTLVGSMAMLIMSDEYYIKYKVRRVNGLSEDTKSDILATFVFMQIIMFVYCMGLMYFGNILDIATYKSIGGTFLVLWGLDLQRGVMKQLGVGWTTVWCGVVLLNLYICKQLITWYPEYCIFF